MTQIIPYAFRSIVSSWRVKFTAEDSFLISQLGNLRNINIEKFSSSLREILSHHQDWREIDRVCLVLRLGLSNQIMVVSSNNREETPNLMNPGYSCFVSSYGSLIEIPNNACRVYENLETICQSFQRQAKPIQRSIHLIKKMGFQSGLCLPLGDNRNIYGYIFLNSCKSSFFQLKHTSSIVLSLINLYGSLCIKDTFQEVESYHIANELLNNSEFFNGTIFSPEKITNSLNKMLSVLSSNNSNKNIFFQTAFDYKSEQLLISLGNVAFSITWLTTFFELKEEPIVIDWDRETNEIVLNIKIDTNSATKKQSQKLIKSLKQKLYFLGHGIELEDDSLKLWAPIDRVASNTGSVLYSTGEDFRSSTHSYFEENQKRLSSGEPPSKELNLNQDNIASLHNILNLDDDRLCSLLYMSIASSDFKQEDLASIMEASIRNNTKNEISGCLVWHSGIFFQVLEGTKKSILETLSRIEQDRRHSQIRYIFNSPIQDRYFSNWAMTLHQSSSLDLEIINRILAARNRSIGKKYIAYDGSIEELFQLIKSLFKN